MILSLTRTSRVGYLRDIRRITVALSRARLGLYILGRRAVFESCYELREAFQLLFKREDKLLLATGEVYPTERLLGDEVQGTKMVGVEHLGQYVFEMTSAKVEALRRGNGKLEGAEAMEEDGGQMSGVEDEDRGAEDEEEEEGEEEEEEEEEEGGDGDGSREENVAGGAVEDRLE